jgi:hypothetical protein
MERFKKSKNRVRTGELFKRVWHGLIWELFLFCLREKKSFVKGQAGGITVAAGSIAWVNQFLCHLRSCRRFSAQGFSDLSALNQ